MAVPPSKDKLKPTNRYHRFELSSSLTFNGRTIAWDQLEKLLIVNVQELNAVINY